MNTLIRTPAREQLTWRVGDNFDNLFEGFFHPMRWNEEPVNEGLVPRLDVVENDNEFVVHAEMPGLRKDDIHITLEDGVLTIEAEAKSEVEEKDGSRIVRQERRYGRYVRSLRLGKEVDERKVNANYRDGVLELTLPKAEEVKPRKINVNIS
ncbi:MAG: Hsp20/alpha crystallin family protein [Acidiferrobacterales bacterium]